MKFLICIFLFIGISWMSGCRTGGKWVSPNSTGIKVISANSSISKGAVIPAKPKIIAEDLTVINKPKKTTNKTVSEKDSSDNGYRSKPELPKNSIPENSNLDPKYVSPQSAGEAEPFKPHENIVNLTMNVAPNDPPKTKGKVDKPINNVIIDEKMKIDWVGLFMFYFMAIIAIIITWMLFDLARDFINKQKQDKNNPFTKTPTTKRKTKRKIRRRKSSTRVAAHNKK